MYWGFVLGVLMGYIYMGIFSVSFIEMEGHDSQLMASGMVEWMDHGWDE